MEIIEQRRLVEVKRVVGKVPRIGDSAKSLVRNTDNSSSDDPLFLLRRSWTLGIQTTVSVVQDRALFRSGRRRPRPTDFSLIDDAANENRTEGLRRHVDRRSICLWCAYSILEKVALPLADKTSFIGRSRERGTNPPGKYGSSFLSFSIQHFERESAFFRRVWLTPCSAVGFEEAAV